jgi:beta-lactamase regulating signal transducer with metallopeptidase domain
VWYAAHRLRIDQEQASDDYVLGLETSPADYAEHLLGITRGLAARTSLAAVTMAEGSGLEARLQAILDPSLPRGAVSALSAAFAALVVSLVLVSATGIRLTEAAELTAS